MLARLTDVVTDPLIGEILTGGEPGLVGVRGC